MTLKTISPEQLNQLKVSGQEVELIDVRTPMEFQEVHVEFARNIPLDRLEAAGLHAVGSDPFRTVYTICRSGGRGQQACERLHALGMTNAVNVEGGTRGWEQAGLPVTRGKKVISLERQVRIAAGTLVLTGILLGVFVHPYWLGLSAFVGAGLIFAGVTDYCGMALLLAKMPWNRVKESPGMCQTPRNA